MNSKRIAQDEQEWFDYLEWPEWDYEFDPMNVFCRHDYPDDVYYDE